MVTVKMLSPDPGLIKEEFDRIKVDSLGKNIMLPKSGFYVLKVEGTSSICANVIKQQMLSNGGDAAVGRGAIDGSAKNSDCIILGTLKQFQDLTKKLKLQPWGLSGISDEIRDVLNNISAKTIKLDCRGRSIVLGKKTLIMGVLNATPDSFSDGGMFLDTDKAIEHILRMEEKGADIIDLGGESSRPGSGTVQVEQELKRVIPILKKAARRVSVPISIDTRKSKVAKEAIEHGASIINDISSLTYDAKMAKVASKYNVAVILMHMKGAPSTMQKNPSYQDVVSEVYRYLKNAVERALKSGIAKDKIIIDPGIGFGKRLEDNIALLRRLKEFKSLGRPIAIGTSRKSFLGSILNKDIDKRLYGSLASCACAIINGADIVRVHDVEETKDLARIIDRIAK
ncbi:MAG: dihydropteroate synthase [Candidatus Omnitrophica bacterium]|nr:dihydropteroate synthase [Candidatus Omnitrophota bacterium]